MKRFLPILFCLLPFTIFGQISVPTDSVGAVLDEEVWCPQLDYNVLCTLQQQRTPYWNQHWVWVSNSFACAPLPAAGFAVAGLSNTGEERQYLLSQAAESGVALLFTAGVTSGIKNLVRRPRPYLAFPKDLQTLQPVMGKSFPSGHTSFAFCAATSLTLMYPEWYVALPAYLWAASVGFSRLYIGAHYPTDVLAGALVGSGCSILVHCLRQRMAQEEPALATPKAIVVPVVISF